MTDGELEQILRTTIANSEKLLEQGQVTIDVAIGGLTKIRADLSERWPECSDSIRARLLEWIRAHTN